MEDDSEVNIMSDNKSTLRRIIDRNVERHLVKEFLMNNTKKADLGLISAVHLLELKSL